MGVTEDTKNVVYLRGETAQGIFVNFKNVERAMRLKVPFGIAQTGKAFRKETSFLELENLNKWNLNFSASQTQI